MPAQNWRSVQQELPSQVFDLLWSLILLSLTCSVECSCITLLGDFGSAALFAKDIKHNVIAGKPGGA